MGVLKEAMININKTVKEMGLTAQKREVKNQQKQKNI
jgi:hypothetical protein